MNTHNTNVLLKGIALQKLPIFSHVILLVVFILLPFFVDDFQLSQLSLFCCYGLLAISLSLVWGQLGLLCLGQAIFFGLGAYAIGLTTLDMIPFLSNQLTQGQQWIGLLLAMAVPMLVAYFISLLLFNGRRLDGAYLGLVTLALALIVERFFEHWKFAGGVNGLIGLPSLHWQGNPLSETALYYVTVAVVICICILLYFLRLSRFGLLLTAIREDETRIKHLGVDTKAIKTRLFVLSAGIAGLAGALFATQLFFVSPKLVGFALSTEVLIWVAVGGRYSFTAAFLGAIFVRVLESQLGDTFEQYWQLIVGLVFITIVLFFPKGLFGKVFR